MLPPLISKQHWKPSLWWKHVGEQTGGRRVGCAGAQGEEEVRPDIKESRKVNR